MRSPRALLGVLSGLLALSGCSGAAASPVNDPASPSSRNVQVSATFSTTAGAARTYDESLVAAGARVAVTSTSSGDTTTVSLAVRGLLPNRAYGAHAHTHACGATGADAGKHFQNIVDPVQPSVDPQYANPENEIWLDITTDATGAGSSRATVPWAFPLDRRAHSVVIHSSGTAAGPAGAGAAGAPAACVSVEF